MDDYLEHTTTQKETFDIIALNYYDNENQAGLISQANPKYADVLVFDAGIKLQIPILKTAPPESLPPWRRT